MALVKPSLLFSARASSRFLLRSETLRVLHTPEIPSSLRLFLDGKTSAKILMEQADSYIV